MQLYSKQRDILESLVLDKETYVHAANATGKSRIAAVAVIWFFASRSPCKVVTTSASETQLKNILWGEIASLLSKSRIPLPFDATYLLLRKKDRKGGFVPENYVTGYVSRTVESFQGHHLPHDKPRVLFVFEEASGIPDEFKDAADSQAHRTLCIGNPLSTTSFFYRGCKAGPKPDPSGDNRYFRNVIHVGADDSPNVQIGREFAKRGIKKRPPIIIPGVVSYQEYLQRDQEWDEVKKQTRLHGQFYEGEQMLLYPMAWLDQSQAEYRRLAKVADADPDQPKPRTGKAIGVDVAMGGRDNTVWVVADEKGVLELVCLDTPNTMEIPGRTIELMRKWSVPSNCVAMDAGGGGHQIADRMAELGHKITAVSFGESASDRKAYRNRRAEMYGVLRALLNPDMHNPPFAIPDDDHLLRQELAVMPLMYDSEGCMILPPKDRATASRHGVACLRDILGRSPDRADAVVLAAWALTELSSRFFTIDPAKLQISPETHAEYQEEIQSRVAELMAKLQ